MSIIDYFVKKQYSRMRFSRVFFFPMPKLTFHKKLTIHARHSLEEASQLARFSKHTEVEVEHLLLALFLEKGSLGSILLRSMGFETDTLSAYCLQKKNGSLTLASEPILSEAVKTAMRRAYSLANEFQYPYVGTEHFVYALMEMESLALDTLIDTLGVDEKKIESTLAAHMNFDHLPSLGKLLETSDPNLAKKEATTETPFLDQFTTNLNQETKKKNDAFIGREAEIDRLVQILSRKNKNNPLLLGEPGVGKTALVSALASKIESGSVPYHLAEKKILSLDLALIVAGTNFRGEFENRLKEIVREAEENPNIILFIDEIHTLVGAGNTQGGLDAANILKPSLARGELRVIGATTFNEYKKYIEKDAALERRFQTVELIEPTPQEAKDILAGVRTSYETFHGVAIPQPLLDRAVELSVRFLPDRFLPDKALDIIDEAQALARHSLPVSKDIVTKGKLERQLREINEKKQEYIREEAYDEAALLKNTEGEVREQLVLLEEKLSGKKTQDLPYLEKIHIDKTVSRMTHIPYDVIAKDSPLLRITRLQKALQQNLVGQKKVADEVVHALTHSSLGIQPSTKPLASFLFLGGTGVGKTFTAKLIAEHFFSHKDALIRFDMSEFGERHSVAQMIGAPAGYVGYGEGGKLTEAIRRRPYSVVLFDEIDKAHPDVWNILLQVLDEGKLTDAEGRTVDFRNTVIILTSNQGSGQAGQDARIGFETKDKKGVLHPEALAHQEKSLIKKVQKSWRPELFARLGTVLVFAPLTPAAVKQIVQNEIKNLKKLFKEKGVTLSSDAAVTNFLAKGSNIEAEGARTIHKIIRDQLERPLVTALLKNPDIKIFTCKLDKTNTIVCQSASPSRSLQSSVKKSARR